MFRFVVLDVFCILQTQSPEKISVQFLFQIQIVLIFFISHGSVFLKARFRRHMREAFLFCCNYGIEKIPSKETNPFFSSMVSTNTAIPLIGGDRISPK